MAGLGSAVLVSVTPAALAIAGSIRWTREYWLAELAILGSAALTGALSYVFRHAVPPKSGA